MATALGKLSDGEMDQLETWIGAGPKRFTLLYSATGDGCVATTFHQKCDNQGPTVTVLYNPQDSVYGGYTGQSWSGSDAWINDPTAFLYQLKFSGNDQRTKFPVVHSNSVNAIYSDNTFGPTFGGGHNLHTFSNTINMSNGVYALTGYVKFNDTYYQMSNVSPRVKSWDDINNGTMNVTELEVYKVTGKMLNFFKYIIKRRNNQSRNVLKLESVINMLACKNSDRKLNLYPKHTIYNTFLKTSLIVYCLHIFLKRQLYKHKR